MCNLLIRQTNAHKVFIKILTKIKYYLIVHISENYVEIENH